MCKAQYKQQTYNVLLLVVVGTCISLQSSPISKQCPNSLLVTLKKFDIPIRLNDTETNL